MDSTDQGDRAPMKPRDMIACAFAGYGIYLAFSGLFAALGATAAIAAFSHSSHVPISGVMLAQSVFALLPVVIGVLLALFARKLAALAVQLAGLESDATLGFPITPRALMAVLLAMLGIYLLVTHVAELVRVAFLVFEAKASARPLAQNTATRVPDASQMIVHVIGAGGGAWVASKCVPLASRLMPE